MPYEFRSLNRTLDTTRSSKPSARCYGNESSIRWDSPDEARSLTPHAFSTSDQHGKDEWIQREFPSNNAIAEGRAGTPPRTDYVRPRAGESDGNEYQSRVSKEEIRQGMAQAIPIFLSRRNPQADSDAVFQLALEIAGDYILSSKQKKASSRFKDKKYTGNAHRAIPFEISSSKFHFAMANELQRQAAALQSGQGASSSRGEGSSPGYEEGEMVTGQEEYAGEERADTFADIAEDRKDHIRGLIDDVINHPVHQYELGYQDSKFRKIMRQECNQMSRIEFEFAKNEVNTNEDLSYKEKVIDILRYYTRHDSGASQYYEEW